MYELFHMIATLHSCFLPGYNLLPRPDAVQVATFKVTKQTSVEDVKALALNLVHGIDKAQTLEFKGMGHVAGRRYTWKCTSVRLSVYDRLVDLKSTSLHS